MQEMQSKLRCHFQSIKLAEVFLSGISNAGKGMGHKQI